MIDVNWVDRTLGRMTVAEKVGQLLCPRIDGFYHGNDDETLQKYIHWIHEYKIGGVEVFFGDVYGVANLLNRLQRESDVPLLVSCDAETGMAHRIRGATHLTHNMGLAASGNERIAYLQGKITAIEATALGVHVFEGPTVDVNVDPANPIINVRSFSDDPDLVSRMGSAYIKGLQDHGMIACAKHFPGHGNTAIDSHMDLPVIDVDRETFERIDLAPFRAAIDAGTMAVMTAHIHVPAIGGESRLPATLSHTVTTGLLRETMGFDGLVMSDFLMMDAITRYFPPGDAELECFKAGTDILLGPYLELAHKRIVRAVNDGEVPMALLDTSVRRILTAKSWLDLHDERFVDVKEIPHRVASGRTVLDGAKEIARSSITLLRNRDDVLPIDPDEDQRIMSVIYYDYPGLDVGDVFHEEVRRRVEGGHREAAAEATWTKSDLFHPVTIPCDRERRVEEETLCAAEEYDMIVVALIYRIIMRRGTPDLRPEAVRFLDRLCAVGKPVVAVSFCSPYVIRQLPEAAGFVEAYMYSQPVLKAVVEALFGEIPFTGHLPVALDI